MLISRRYFIRLAGLLPFTRLAWADKRTSSRSLDVSSLDIHLPLWLLGARQAKGTSKLLLIEDNGNEVSLVLSGDRKKAIDPTKTVRRILTRHNEKHNRETMLIKRLNSYMLDGTFMRFRDKRSHQSGSLIRMQFDSFQSQEILEAVPIRSVIALFASIQSMRRFSSVSWSVGKSRFFLSA